MPAKARNNSTGEKKIKRIQKKSEQINRVIIEPQRIGNYTLQEIRKAILEATKKIKVGVKYLLKKCFHQLSL